MTHYICEEDATQSSSFVSFDLSHAKSWVENLLFSKRELCVLYGWRTKLSLSLIILAMVYYKKEGKNSLLGVGVCIVFWGWRVRRGVTRFSRRLTTHPNTSFFFLAHSGFGNFSPFTSKKKVGGGLSFFLKVVNIFPRKKTVRNVKVTWIFFWFFYLRDSLRVDGHFGMIQWRCF